MQESAPAAFAARRAGSPVELEASPFTELPPGMDASRSVIPDLDNGERATFKGKAVAVKVLIRERKGEFEVMSELEAQEQLLQEAEKMMSRKHKNVLCLKAVVLNQPINSANTPTPAAAAVAGASDGKKGDEPALVLEFCQPTSLLTQLNRFRHLWMTLASVADFGFARWAMKLDRHGHPEAVTNSLTHPLWRAPELLEKTFPLTQDGDQQPPANSADVVAEAASTAAQMSDAESVDKPQKDLPPVEDGWDHPRCPLEWPGADSPYVLQGMQQQQPLQTLFEDCTKCVTNIDINLDIHGCTAAPGFAFLVCPGLPTAGHSHSRFRSEASSGSGSGSTDTGLGLTASQQQLLQPGQSGPPLVRQNAFDRR
eukprot:gene3007-3287_t